MSNLNNYQSNKLNSLKSAQLTSLRERSQLMLKKSEIPHRRIEDWKYTNLTKTFEKSYTPNQPSEKVNLLDNDLGFKRIVFIDGVFQESLSDSVEIQITAISKSNVEDFSPSTKEDFLTTLNYANLDIGNLFTISESTSFDSPILIDSYFTGSQAQRNVTNYIVAHKFSSTHFVERINTSEEVFVNTMTHFELKECATCHYTTLQAASMKSFIGITQKSNLSKDSRLNAIAINLGGEVSRTNLFSTISGKNSSSDMHGLYALKESQHHDTNSYTQHISGETTAHQLYKGILADSSRGVFTGKIRIEKDAQLVAAEQLNKNLLLSKKAQANSRPQLEIYADDVKCAHGSTTGQISPDQLFYFQARGVSKNRAQKLLAKAFVNEVVFKIENENVKKFITAELVKREIV